MDSWWQVFSVGKSECLTQPNQMQLYQKLEFLIFEIFAQFFSTVLKFTSNFEHFEKNVESHSWFISEVIDSKTRGYLNA